jgi:hypothetical protein
VIRTRRVAVDDDGSLAVRLACPAAGPNTTIAALPAVPV